MSLFSGLFYSYFPKISKGQRNISAKAAGDPHQKKKYISENQLCLLLEKTFAFHIKQNPTILQQLIKEISKNIISSLSFFYRKNNIEKEYVKVISWMVCNKSPLCPGFTGQLDSPPFRRNGIALAVLYPWTADL